jgi:hypothetical protein
VEVVNDELVVDYSRTKTVSAAHAFGVLIEPQD